MCLKFAEQPKCRLVAAVVLSLIIVICVFYACSALCVFGCEYFRRRKGNYSCVRKDSRSSAVAVREMRLRDYLSVPRDESENTVTLRRNAVRYAPSLGAISLQAEESNLGPIVEEAEDEKEAIYANITKPITPVDEMRWEMARMNRNIFELAEGSRQNRRNERRHTIGY